MTTLLHLLLDVLQESWHAPPFLHGTDAHSSVSVEHSVSEKPTLQLQKYDVELAVSMHGAPFLHGLLAHAGTIVSQCVPT